MTLKEIWLIINGYHNRVTEQRRQTRLIMFTMVSIWAEKGPKTPEELWQLPGDEDKKITEQETKTLMERFAKLPKLNG